MAENPDSTNNPSDKSDNPDKSWKKRENPDNAKNPSDKSDNPKNPQISSQNPDNAANPQDNADEMTTLWKKPVNPDKRRRKVEKFDLSEDMFTDLRNCARCGGDHAHIQIKPFTNPPPEYTHFMDCPTLGEPVLVNVTAVFVASHVEENSKYNEQEND